MTHFMERGFLKLIIPKRIHFWSETITSPQQPIFFVNFDGLGPNRTKSRRIFEVIFNLQSHITQISHCKISEKIGFSTVSSLILGKLETFYFRVGECTYRTATCKLQHGETKFAMKRCDFDFSPPWSACEVNNDFPQELWLLLPLSIFRTVKSWNWIWTKPPPDSSPSTKNHQKSAPNLQKFPKLWPFGISTANPPERFFVPPHQQDSTNRDSDCALRQETALMNQEPIETWDWSSTQSFMGSTRKLTIFTVGAGNVRSTLTGGWFLYICFT